MFVPPGRTRSCRRTRAWPTWARFHLDFLDRLAALQGVTSVGLVEVLDGRAFEPADHVSALGNVVISRSLARQLWPGQRAVGRRLQQQGSTHSHTVVGVVADVMQYGFRDTPQALVYYPMVGPTPTGPSHRLHL